MRASRFLLAAVLVLLAPSLGMAGCDTFGGATGPPSVSDRLEVTDYASTQPASLAAYADAGAIGGYGSVWLYDLGTGPSDPPRLLRSIRIPGVITTSAQVDARGYVWVATPDLLTGGPHDQMYVVDPFRGTVQRVIELPTELRAVADLSAYADGVIVRSWRNGFSGALGRISPQCAVEAGLCEATLFSELGDVLASLEPSIQKVDGKLYSMSNGNGENTRNSIDEIDPATGQILRSLPFAGKVAADEQSLFFQKLDAPGVFSFNRLSLDSFELSGAVPSENLPLVAYQNGLLYRSTYQGAAVHVVEPKTLRELRTVDVSAAGGVSETFAFASPGVLMLNGTASVNVETGEVLLDPARDRADLGSDPGRLRLPQGHPLGN